MAAKKNPFHLIVRNRNYRLLWSGQATSFLGDQFYMIAMPWLVLKTSGDPLVLGSVMALAGIPRAIFMLLGGAISDRFSARTIMMISDGIRLCMTAGLAALVYTGSVQVWMLYAFALGFGIVGGFFAPAANSMVPHIVERDSLQSGNALFQGVAQLTNFIGPMLAGGLIAMSASKEAANAVGTSGLALAFGLDATTFAISIITLALMRIPSFNRPTGSGNLLSAIGAGIHFALNDNLMRVIFILVAASNLLFSGPLMVGTPVLANLRLGGASAFGLIMSAYGGGNLLGILLAGTLPRVKGSYLNRLIAGLLAGFGLALAGFAFISSAWVAFGMMFLLGIGNGYFAIIAVTILQQRTPPALIGRIMSLLTFANMGLVPISMALTGFLIKQSVTGLFVSAGILMLVLAGWTAFGSSTRQMGEMMTVSASPAD